MGKENTKRDNLYLFRCSKRLSQQEMADKIGVDRMTYAKIENGKSDGSMRFWNALKAAFAIDDRVLLGLMKNGSK